jgi:hypothetical protein
MTMTPKAVVSSSGWTPCNDDDDNEEESDIPLPPRIRQRRPTFGCCTMTMTRMMAMILLTWVVGLATPAARASTATTTTETSDAPLHHHHSPPNLQPPSSSSSYQRIMKIHAEFLIQVHVRILLVVVTTTEKTGILSSTATLASDHHDTSGTNSVHQYSCSHDDDVVVPQYVLSIHDWISAPPEPSSLEETPFWISSLFRYELEQQTFRSTDLHCGTTTERPSSLPPRPSSSPIPYPSFVVVSNCSGMIPMLIPRTQHDHSSRSSSSSSSTSSSSSRKGTTHASSVTTTPMVVALWEVPADHHHHPDDEDHHHHDEDHHHRILQTKRLLHIHPYESVFQVYLPTITTTTTYQNNHNHNNYNNTSHLDHHTVVPTTTSPILVTGWMRGVLLLVLLLSLSVVLYRQWPIQREEEAESSYTDDVGHRLPSSSYPSVPMEEEEEESNENHNDQLHWRSPTLQNHLYPDCHHGDNPIVPLVQHPHLPPPQQQQQQPSSSVSSSDDDDDLSPPIVERCSIENDSFVQYLDRIHTFTQQQQQQQQPPPLSSPQPTHDNHHDTIPCRTACGCFVATGTSVDLGNDTSPSTVPVIGAIAPIQLWDGTGSNETTNNNHVSDATTTRTETTNHWVEDRPCDTTTTTHISCTPTQPYVVCMEFISDDNHHDGPLPSERTIHADHDVETMEQHNVSMNCDDDTNETTVTSIATNFQHTPMIVDQLQEELLQRKIVTASTRTKKIRPDTENHHPPLATATLVQGENDQVRCRISPKCLYLDPHHHTRHDQNVPFVATTTTVGTSKRSRSELEWSETEPTTIHPILVSVPTDDDTMDTHPDQRTLPAAAAAAAAVIFHTNSSTDQYGVPHPAMDPTHGVVLYHSHRLESMSETKENTYLPAAQSNSGSKDKPTDYTLDGNKVQHYHNSISHPNEQQSSSDPDTGGTPPWLRSAPPPTALLSQNVLPKIVRPTRTTIPKHTSPDNFSYVSTLPPNSLCSDNDDDDDDYDYPDGVPNHAPPAGNFARRYPVGTVLGTVDRQSLLSSSHKRKDPPEQNKKCKVVRNNRSVATANLPRAKTTLLQPPPIPLPAAAVPMDRDSHKKLKWTRNRKTNLVVQPNADHRTATTTATTTAATTTTVNTSGTSPWDTLAIQPDIPLSLSLRSAAEAANDSGWWIYHPPPHDDHGDHGGGGVVESMVSSSTHATKKKKRTLPKSIHIQKKKYVL